MINLVNNDQKAIALSFQLRNSPHDMLCNRIIGVRRNNLVDNGINVLWNLVTDEA
ncbi:MAG: hypothetical protein AAF383_27485 [Cyanobacteria bacterium P01_A01_bin.83]